MWENSKSYWGTGNGIDSNNIGIVPSEIEDYTDYERTTAQTVTTTANIIGGKIDDIAVTVAEDAKSIYDIAKYYPLIIIGTGLVVLLSYSNVSNLKKVFK